ncbi:DgaE family pyridoxal phosphate-dependent ammonia lyase [Spiroplasma sp. SV19]|uniref:DgaE family pyridoxal phosphate-dependent ammonia lyase n=1 Tax=Spiroplasma sp. SV19 TaxID=2570468 RepID=UPI0024B85330|nr:DgaE family pyridoxal phosphate-dependent ammonia lyase [Spiroplasma sp. SV19]WHQ37449.1 DgaE family pyridoxal phosphate-dependent ammonia lyase [Spiroplasma sp. SV19]
MKTQSKNIYQQLGLKKVINAAGKMSIIGVSTISDTVGQAIATAGKEYVVIKDLLQAASKHLATLLKVEDVHIVNCAAGGIVQAVAGVIAKDNYLLQMNINKNVLAPNEIILPKGHNVNFGGAIETMVNLGGGIVQEAGYANLCSQDDLKAQINSQTAAILYIKSHHSVQKSILSVPEAIAVAKAAQIPFIIDCAAEEDLQKYYQMGADIIIYSGSKAISGPTSGLILGKKRYLDFIRGQSNGIGRAMKIGKENIAGLILAIEEYLNNVVDKNQQVKLLNILQRKLSDIPGIKGKLEPDDAGRELFRLKLTIDTAITKYHAIDLVNFLEQSNPQIITRNNFVNKNIIYFDSRVLTRADLEIISETIHSFTNKGGN